MAVGEPSTSSVEPPPMSATSSGSATPGRPATAPVNDSSASARPVITSGSTPRVRCTIARNSSALPASRVAEVATIRTRTAPSSAMRRGVVRQRLPGALDRRRGQPAGPVDPLAEPDHPHLAVHVGQPHRAAVGHQQPDRVGAAVDGRHPVHDCRASGSGRFDARARLPPVAQRGQRLVAQRVHPGPGGQRVRHQHVQALHPGGHSAGRDAAGLGHLTELLAPGQVGLVRSPVAGGQVRVGAQPGGHLPHQPGRLQGGDSATTARGQVR